jgi:hypothetical protein
MAEVTVPAGVKWRRAACWVTAALVGLVSWLLRFNDPGGSFAGMTDDHFFYVVRGWQILFGDLPVRDFVDQGAPLYYYIAAAVQWLGGRGTFSEIAFSVTILAVGAGLTFWLAAEAAGSIAAGLIGAALQVFLEPRFYNYPKILAYAFAIPAIWRFADRPTAYRRTAVALIAAIAFLLRHDHGVFVAGAMGLMLLFVPAMPVRERIRHALLFGATVLVLLAPYALFVEVNGGVASYLRQAAAWAERDRTREPVGWPGLFDNPDGVSEAARQSTGLVHAVAVLRDNRIAWMFYTELTAPVAALVVLALVRCGARPDWPNATAKLAMVAVLAEVLNAGFLRSPLEGRLADPSVPHAILVAWLCATAVRLITRPRAVVSARLDRVVPVAATAGVVIAMAVVGVYGTALTGNMYDRLDKATLVEGPGAAVRKALYMAGVYRTYWPLERWAKPDMSGPIRLAFYLRECTRPTDRVLLQYYMPQAFALADRAFAGGHADLRPGFFRTDEAQQLTIARLQRQSVPLVILETGDALENFRKSFPLITAYLDRRYDLVGDRALDERYAIHVLASRSIVPVRRYERLDLPCFR